MKKAFITPLEELEGFRLLRERMRGGTGMLQVTGCIDSQKAHLCAALADGRKCVLIVAPNELRAREICDNYRLFDPNVLLYPARDFIFFQADVQSSYLAAQRVQVMKALAMGEPCTVVLTMSALMSRCMRPQAWADGIRALSVGDEVDLQKEQVQLKAIGYERAEQAERPGQYARRGGILDIFPLTSEHPVRLELWGDEIDSIRAFDPASQRSLEEMSSVLLYPAAEFTADAATVAAGLTKIGDEAKKQEKYFRDRARSEEAHRVKMMAEDVRTQLQDFGRTQVIEGLCDYFYPDAVSILSYFPADTAVFLDEPARMKESALEAEKEFRESMSQRLLGGYVLPSQAGFLFTEKEIEAQLSERRTVGLFALDGSRNPFAVSDKVSIGAAGISSYNQQFEMLIRDLKRYRSRKYRVILLCASRTRGRRLAEDILAEGLTAFYSEDEERVPARGEIQVIPGQAHRGYEYPEIRFAVITESDIFGREKKPRKKRAFHDGQKIRSFSELNPGDYVVHENHGIGIYRGIETVTVDHVRKDYMKIEYAGGSCLYVLATQLDVIQKYAGAEAKEPKISKLGTGEWQRTKGRVRGAVRQIAQELVDLYAARQNGKGYVYGPDTTWQTEFEELFPFEETEDQLTAIADTKKDMESPKIMDRLICGDVGYGKTEIAIRAAFKAVQENKQVALLVPTTILAQQHYNTFVQRMKDYPVRIDLLCRFRSRAEQSKTLKDLAAGRVDIVIGTHRLLSKDVAFRDLGLLVVDEEQRFGVTHKEKIKQLRKNVDVLTLTATPIPRTLHMSLIGIRDMSVLEEAPQDRLPIQTFVMEYSDETVREAISREMARGGQSYVVYNHISTISDLADRIHRLVPQARVGWAHGKMNEKQLEDIMYDFINGDLDVLVTTTIIETGLDIPNVNTMIVCEADRMGLSQLYQLRGRVGRSSRTAYAFLTYKKDRVLKETAEKRLSAIREFTELGAGFRIAMRDLEIRGAGNLLGAEQSGHMAEVGYDLYCKLLGESVQELKGEKSPDEEFDTSIDLDMDAAIPDSYVKNENQKLDLYRRIALISDQQEYDDMLDELVDRFGEPPRIVQDLLRCALLKAKAHRVYVTDLSRKGDEIRFTFYEKARIDGTKIDAFLRSYRGRMRLVMEKQPCIVYHLLLPEEGKRDVFLRLTGEILENMEKSLLQTE